MDISAEYKTAKQNTALLKIFSEGFPENQLNMNESTIQRFVNKWNNCKRPVHDAQSIFLLCAQECLERKRDELQNQAVNFGLPVQLDPRNQINKGRSRWTGLDPTSGSNFQLC